MKAMKLMSLFTVVAVAATIGASYAMWDNDTDSKTTSLTISESMTVSVGTVTFNSSTPLAPTGAQAVTAGTAVDSLSSTFSVDVTSSLAAKTKLTLTAEDLKVGGTAMSAAAQSALSVKFTESDDTPLTGGVDSSVTATNSYNVVVTLDETKVTNDVLTELAGKTIGFNVKAVAAPTTI